MSNLGRVNPGNREQFTMDCVFRMTFVAVRHLSTFRHRRNVHISRDHCTEQGKCAGYSLEIHSVEVLLIWTAHLSSKREVQADSAENIHKAVDFLSFM